jgi:hypothetical protein
MLWLNKFDNVAEFFLDICRIESRGVAGVVWQHCCGRFSMLASNDLIWNCNRMNSNIVGLQAFNSWQQWHNLNQVQQRRNETVQHQISSGWEKPANHG